MQNDRLLKESAARKSDLAQKLFSDAMLIAACRFYVHQLRIKASQVAAALLDSVPMPHYEWKHHTAAMRRVMGVQRIPRQDGTRVYELPGNLEFRVQNRIGLQIWTPEFKLLKPQLVIGYKELDKFAQEHPILARTISFLLESQDRIAAQEAEEQALLRVNPNTGQAWSPAGILDYMPSNMRHRFTHPISHT
jgi:hypothetical protein